MKTLVQFLQQMGRTPLLIKTEGYDRWAPLFLRLVIGFGFMDHGRAKLSRGPEHFEQLLVQIGAPFPHFISLASPLVEILGGLAIFAGAIVTIASLPLIVIILTALFTVHLKYGFSSINTIAGLVSFILGGAGIFSVDSWIIGRK